MKEKKLNLEAFEAKKLSTKQMNPIIGGIASELSGNESISQTGSNSTNSTGADSDTKHGDSDQD